MVSPAKKTATALWLVPDGEAAAYFRETIARLAARYEAPVFAPHLTLGLGPAALIDKIPFAPLELEVTEVACSEGFTKTLFVRFALSPALAKLRSSLGMEATGYDPHLSLLYRELSDPLKRQLATALSVPFPAVTFNAIAAIRCPAEVVTRADVEAWETVATKALA